MNAPRKILLSLAAMLIVACSSGSSGLDKLNAHELVYFSVDFKSLAKEYPELAALSREELISRLKSLGAEELSELINSKFTFPYMILSPAFENGKDEEAISAALKILDFLEGKGLDIYKTDNAGCSSIHMAYSFKQTEILSLLTERYEVSKFKGNKESISPACRQDAIKLLETENLSS